MDNADRVRAFWRRVWSEGDTAYVHELFAQRYVHNGAERPAQRLADIATGFREDFGDAEVEVVQLLAAGDLVVSRILYRGVHRRDWPGVPATGARVQFSGLDVFRFEGATVVEHLHEADHEALWEQLGVALPPEPPKSP